MSTQQIVDDEMSGATGNDPTTGRGARQSAGGSPNPSSTMSMRLCTATPSFRLRSGPRNGSTIYGLILGSTS
jgi:hypothetical protein